MSTILLTGATGFLGSHIARTLLANGHVVVALKRSTSRLNRLDGVVSAITFYDVDGLDLDTLFKEHRQIDAIIHTATTYGRHNETVSEIFAANTGFPLQLLDAGCRVGVKVFINTDTILDKYLNIYSLSKNQLLQWGKFFSIHNKIKFINLRLEHFYGPTDDPTKFTTFVINNCMANTPELKLTLGEQRRDFIYIDDVVSAYLLVLEKARVFDQSFVEFDVGTGESVSIRSFVEAVHGLTRSQTKLVFGALPYREGEVMHSAADTTGLRSLGWQYQYDLVTGLKMVIKQ